jgi:hypothetical protein
MTVSEIVQVEEHDRALRRAWPGAVRRDQRGRGGDRPAAVAHSSPRAAIAVALEIAR